MSAPGDAASWARLRRAFDDLVRLDSAGRTARLAEIGASDLALRDELETLLAVDASIDDRLARIERVFNGGAPLGPDPLGMAGRTIGHFHVIAPHASGGMGVVYRAEDTRLRRVVALKFPLPDLHLDHGARARFLREAQLAATLDHPNICSIHEAGETDDGHLFLAMPLYDGETLSARLARDGALDPGDAVSIARQMAEGVRAAHAVGIVHRDLKPANVMLLGDGSVRLLDFGLAKTRDLTLTSAGSRLGTTAYMAPEQIRGGTVDGRADLWAIGVMLYEMLTGRRPFTGENDAAITYAIIDTEPPPPSSLRPGIGADTDRLVASLLRKEPAERLPSASDLAREAGAMASAVRAGGDGLPDVRAHHPRRVRRAPLAAGVVAVAALIAAGAWLLNMRSSPWGETAVSAGDVPRLVGVLPILNVSGDTANDYLAAGLSSALSLHLSWTRALVVPRIHQTRMYRDADVPLQQVARELHAAAVVRGTVSTTRERVVLDLQIADSTGSSTWSRRYESPAADLAGLQAEVLADLLSALRVAVSGEERARITRAPTANAAAYDLLLRGLAAGLLDLEPLERARVSQTYYARARDIDPDFALARAMLADTYWAFGVSGVGRAHSQQARVEAEAALRIDPYMAEAHEALSWYWHYVTRDTAKVLAARLLAVSGAPNDLYHRLRLADVYLDRAMWPEALAELERAARLEPGSWEAAYHLGNMYHRLRRYEEAAAAYAHAIRLNSPYAAAISRIRGFAFLRWQGTIDTLDAALRGAELQDDSTGANVWRRVQVSRIRRRWQDVLTAVDDSPVRVFSSDLSYRPWSLLRGEARAALGDTRRSRAEYENARALSADSVRAHPDDARYRVALGLAYAGLGRKTDAIAEARQTLALAKLSEAGVAAIAAMAGAVEVLVQAGATDAALEQLEILFTMPAGAHVSAALLRVDPTYDPLRADPRFQRLIQRYTQ